MKDSVFYKAKNLLLENQRIDNTNSYTIPSKNLYPHQWSWDSAWIALGLSQINHENFAMNEMITLFKYQWKNGLVPSIAFHNLENNTYWPTPELWNLKEDAKNLIKNPNCTGIIQPPIHSTACMKIFEITKDKKMGRNFLDEIYNKLILWHKYLYNFRDINNNGLIYIRHPWESGMDNSPIWDSSLDRIKIKEFKYSKMRTDNKKVNMDERPTDITYERYMKLIDIFKECKYDEKLISEKSEFIIIDVLFNVLLLKSNYDLLKIAKILNMKNDYNMIQSWINMTETSIENLLYKNDFYYDIDCKTNEHIMIKTISGLSNILYTNKIEVILESLKKEFIDIDKDNYSLSSLSRLDGRYDSINYWRGPMWTNLTWLVVSGLQNKGFNNIAEKIKKVCVKNIEENGFYEYFDSNGNKGCGDNHFSWTAATYICFTSNCKF